MGKEVNEEVLNAMNEAAAPSPAPVVEKEASSQEVKPEQPVVETPVAPVVADGRVNEPVVEKESEINKNLKIALQQEREERRILAEKLAKVEENSSVVDKMKEIFVPKVDTPTPTEKKYLTEEEVTQLLEQKEQERIAAIQKENERNSVTKEIETLSKEWDGSDGKPKYDDSEVLEWQQKNNKIYLRPTEAFNEMKRQEIIDFEVKKRLSGIKDAPVVEKPSGVSVDHTTPSNSKPKTTQELMHEVSEAISSVNAEL